MTFAAAPATAVEANTVEATLQEAFDKMIADSKSQMMRDPVAALQHAEGAETLARNAAAFDDRDFAIATAMWLKGESLARAGKPDESAVVIKEALDLVGEQGMKTKLGGDLLLAHGRVSSRLSDVKTAFKSFFKAHEVFVNLNEPRSEAMALMAIGSIYRDAEAYDRAIEFYARASEVYAADDVLALSAFNNQGNILRELEKFDEARALYENALAIAKKMESDVLQARILTNIADLEARAGDFARAESVADEAFSFLEGDDSTEWARFVYGAKALARLRQGDAEGAEALVDKAFAELDITDTSMSYEEMHDVAYQVHLMRGNYDKALKHHTSFKRLSDNAKKIASSANLAILGAKFHSAEQQLNIERLKNEQMNKDMLLENARRQMTTQVAVIAVGGLSLIFSVAGVIALRNHRNRVARINTQLQATVDRLNGEIARREIIERDLVEAKEVAEQANRMKSTFLATMSHELRTPMNGILGFSKILLSGDLSAEQRDHLEIIEQSGESLLSLINDILDISQMEAGKLKLTNAPFNVRSTVENAVKLLQAKAQEKNLTLAVHVDPALPTMVEGDTDRIRQIVVNLVGNAVKFTEAGSVAVTVAPDANGEGVKISVADTGIGIPADKVDALFDRFSQVDGSLARKHGGSGLGLAICRELVEQMGGEIGVETKLGEGSEFWMSAPLAAAEEMAVLPSTSQPVLEQSQTVVVVDDVSVNRRVYGAMLTAMNAAPLIAGNADAAIELLVARKADGDPIDAVIVNGAIEGVSAEDLVARMRRNALVEDVRVILAASKTPQADKLAAMGFDAAIEHPLTDRTLFAGLNATAAKAEIEETPREGAVIELAQPQLSGRVLVVEDNVSNQQLIAAVLSSFDIDMDLARNGAEAVAAASENAYDMILMDVNMPTMNGVEATRRIRRIDGVNAETPIIALTAQAAPGDREKVISAGMDDYLSKPLEIAPLRSKVQSILSRRRPVHVADESQSAKVIAFDA